MRDFSATPLKAGKAKLKILVHGDSGVGKTELLCSAPGPVGFFLGGERLAEAFKRRYANLLGIRPQPVGTDWEDLAETLRAARDGVLTDKYGIETLAVDGWHLIENAYRKALQERIDDTALGKGQINDAVENLLLRALEDEHPHYFPCHLIVSTQTRNLWGTNEHGVTVTNHGVVGLRPHGHKKLKHPFDLVLRMTLEYPSGKFVTCVDKSRYRDAFQRGQRIENFSWDHLRPLIGRRTDDAPSIEDIKHLWERAGSPHGSIRAWLEAEGFAHEGKISQANRAAAADALEDLIEAKETAA
jgi:hypothetical protein